jgi:16S rRNA (guanine527-N7)-methyltransferase
VSDPRLERWLESLLSTPGLTSIRDPETARRVHVDGSLLALAVVRAVPGVIVDVGSGGGSPGIPLAAALPDRAVTLLEANARKATFLEGAARDFANVRVVRGRAEEQEPESFGVAVARALAPPPVAAEWCLPLVEVDGAVVLYAGPTADRGRVARVAELLGAQLVGGPSGLLVLRKLEPTPPGFPRRTGLARKRPLA